WACRTTTCTPPTRSSTSRTSTAGSRASFASSTSLEKSKLPSGSPWAKQKNRRRPVFLPGRGAQQGARSTAQLDFNKNRRPRAACHQPVLATRYPVLLFGAALLLPRHDSRHRQHPDRLRRRISQPLGAAEGGGCVHLGGGLAHLFHHCRGIGVGGAIAPVVVQR